MGLFLYFIQVFYAMSNYSWRTLSVKLKGLNENTLKYHGNEDPDILTANKVYDKFGLKEFTLAFVSNVNYTQYYFYYLDIQFCVISFWVRGCRFEPQTERSFKWINLSHAHDVQLFWEEIHDPPISE